MKTISEVVEYLQKRIDELDLIVEQLSGDVTKIGIKNSCEYVIVDLMDVLDFINEKEEEN